jgi:excisionase family DNA binding protein
MTASLDGYLGLTALATYAGLSVRTLRARLRDAHDPLPSYRVGGKRLVKRSEFEAWMARRRATVRVDAIVDDVLREFTAR